jgi:pre-mRNA-processing factor 39
MTVDEFNSLRTSIMDEKTLLHQHAQAQLAAQAAAAKQHAATLKAEADVASAKDDVAMEEASPPPPGDSGEAAPKPEEPAPGPSEPPPEAETAAEVKAEPAAGDEAPSTAPAAEAPPPEPVLTVSEDEIRSSYFKIREDYVAMARRELLMRKPYEDSIRRPYFHVKPLDALQLHNWAKYLDFAEARGDQTGAIMLYERCLVACASYPGRVCG